MKPSPCRFVLYCFQDRVSDLIIERPALVTSTSGVDGMTVNVNVFFEAADENVCARGRSGDLDSDPRYVDVPANTIDPMGTIAVVNTWRWPTRV